MKRCTSTARAHSFFRTRYQRAALDAVSLPRCGERCTQLFSITLARRACIVQIVALERRSVRRLVVTLRK